MSPLLIIVFLFACTAGRQTNVSVNNNLPQNITANGKLFASLYQQRAAEYRALCFQAYNIATERVNKAMQNKIVHPAIITDIDETVLDNSPYAVNRALQGLDYEANTWAGWTGRSQADTVPGAFTFLTYAASKGAEIFYITNREEKERSGTLLNLQKYNFPNADNVHLILKQTSSSKESRRQQVMNGRNVILLLGDNLSDFSAMFDKKSYEERLQNTNAAASNFGEKFIVLPNPGYGDWETALYNYNYNLTVHQKDSVIKSRLKTF